MHARAAYLTVREATLVVGLAPENAFLKWDSSREFFIPKVCSRVIPQAILSPDEIAQPAVF